MMWRDAEHWRGRGAVLGLAAALLGGCEAEYNAAQPHLDTKVYPISCEDGRRYAAADLKARNYRITDVVREGTRTVVSGESLDKKGWRHSEVSSSITVDCQANGVMARASGGGGWWVNDSLRFGFYMVADIGDQMWPPPTVPVVKMVLYQGPEAKIEFPTDLEPLGVVAVRVTVLNAGERTLSVDPRDVRAVREEGQSVPPLSAADAERRLSAADPDIQVEATQADQAQARGERDGLRLLPDRRLYRRVSGVDRPPDGRGG